MTVEDLKILYAVYTQHRYAPMLSLVYHWIGLIFKGTSITMTSFVTRIARGKGLLTNAQLDILPLDSTRLVIAQHFIQAHL